MSNSENVEFFTWFKHKSEQHWRTIVVDRGIYGFQIQPGTKWRPGLSPADIARFEQQIGFKFPPIYRDYLRCMNGTDTPMVNVYGDSGHPHAYDTGYYSYPRDLEQIKDRIAWIYEAFDIDEDYVRAHHVPHIMPIVSHRFLIIDNCPTHPVLSMYGTDVIVYAGCLKTFLTDEIAHPRQRLNNTTTEGEAGSSIVVPYWLEQLGD